jgi:hypothetical protein
MVNDGQKCKTCGLTSSDGSGPVFVSDSRYGRSMMLSASSSGTPNGPVGTEKQKSSPRQSRASLYR